MGTKLLDNLPLALVGGAFLVLASATRCTQGGSSSLASPGVDDASADSSIISLSITDMGEQAADISIDAPIDHAMVATPDAGSCTSGDDASACVVPSSVCADNRWLAFFTNGSCQQNLCQWQVSYRDCGEMQCNLDGCLVNVTK